MSTAAFPTPAVPAVPRVALPTVPLRQALTWTVFAGLLLLIAVYFVSSEQGAVALFSGTDVHEWVHDSRHLLGFPCH